MRRLLVLTGAIVLVDTMFFTALTPLLPHYVHKLDLGKGGAGVLQAMYPAGALLAAIPGGIAAARFGVKPTVLTGLSLLALTTTAFGLADSVWTLDLARFVQGVSSAFSWTGSLAWLVAAAPPGRRGQLIGSAFGAAIAGALFGPALGAEPRSGLGPLRPVSAAARGAGRIRGGHAHPAVAAERVVARGRDRRSGILLREFLDARDVDDHRRGGSGRARLRVRVRPREHRVGAWSGRWVRAGRRSRIRDERRRRVFRSHGDLPPHAVRDRALQGDCLARRRRAVERLQQAGLRQRVRTTEERLGLT